MAAPRVALRAKRGAGGGTRTHTTLPSRDFKSLASTSSATSAMLISLAFSAFSRKGFSADLLRFPFRLLGAIQAQDGCEKQHDLKPRETAGPINSPRCTDRPPRLRRSELSSSRRSVEMSCPVIVALHGHSAARPPGDPFAIGFVRLDAWNRNYEPLQSATIFTGLHRAQ